jgi:hypothetical protein
LVERLFHVSNCLRHACTFKMAAQRVGEFRNGPGLLQQVPDKSGGAIEQAKLVGLCVKKHALILHWGKVYRWISRDFWFHLHQACPERERYYRFQSNGVSTPAAGQRRENVVQVDRLYENCTTSATANADILTA